jgi:hypothetical protein
MSNRCAPIKTTGRIPANIKINVVKHVKKVTSQQEFVFREIGALSQFICIEGVDGDDCSSASMTSRDASPSTPKQDSSEEDDPLTPDFKSPLLHTEDTFLRTSTSADSRPFSAPERDLFLSNYYWSANELEEK